MKQNSYIKILATLIFLFTTVSVSALGKRESQTVQVGETFTVNSSGHSRLHGVVWSWDTNVLELVGSLYGTSTSATFKAKKAAPSSGVVVQATVYYYANVGSLATGKFFDTWTIFVKDNTTVSLDTPNKTISAGDSFYLNASPSTTTYTGAYTWKSSNPSVASFSGSGNKVLVNGYTSGRATISVTLDNGKYAECLVVVEDDSTVELSDTRIELSTGDSSTLTATTTPSGYSGTYVWKSTDTSVATCSGNGRTATVNARGSGKSKITVTLSNGSSAECEVEVTDVDVSDVLISDQSLEVEKTITLSSNVSPYNATVKSTDWEVAEGSDVIKISGSNLTGLKPGIAKIYCTVNGNVTSNTATVTVTEPDLRCIKVTPEDGASEISPFITPTASYSHPLTVGPDFDNIKIVGPQGEVEGSVEIMGSKVTFSPFLPLSPLSNYTFVIPKEGVNNKWGSPAQDVATSAFTTSAYEKVELTVSPPSGSYLTKGDGVKLTALPEDAEIYYTTDGSTPSKSSIKYEGTFNPERDFTLKAIAIRPGYEDSDVIGGEYYASQSEVEEYYPNENNPLYNYSLVTPYLKLSGPIEKSNNFRRISLKDSDGNQVEGEPFITNNLIIFIPAQSLLNAMTYVVDVPRDAVKTINGEVFKGYTWSFTTPTLVTKVAMQGDESVLLLTEDAIMKSRGIVYLTTDLANGSFTFKDYESLSQLSTGVDDISTGYTHRLVRKGTTLSGEGLAFCGETGTAAGLSAFGGVKIIKGGFQTSAIIDEENNLWTCGRNDFYQLGDGTGTTTKQFIKVAENVIDVALGNSYMLYVDSENVLWAVGRNHVGQLGDSTTQDRKEPVRIMDGVSSVYASTAGYFSACITTGNCLLTWGDNRAGQLGREVNGFSSIPDRVMDGIMDVSLGEAHILALNDAQELFSWGSNSYKQIAESGGNISNPKMMADKVVMAEAGPTTSIILQLSGKVTGWGKKSHNNFGSGEGAVAGFIIEEGAPYSPLEGVMVEPARFESKPENEFALVAVPLPYSADYETVEWESDKPDIAEVDERGVVKTGKCGEATITVRVTDRFGTIKESQSLIVCTDSPDNSGVSDIISDSRDWMAYAVDNCIVVKSAKIGERFMVYNLQGVMITEEVAVDSELSFNINNPGVYIVRSGQRAVKVICQ